MCDFPLTGHVDLSGLLTHLCLLLTSLFHSSRVIPHINITAELPPAEGENSSVPDGKKRAAPSSHQGVFEENVWFSQPSQSLVSQRGQISTCPRNWNAAPPRTLWATDSMFMRKWWADGGDRRKSHVVAFDAWQDTRCVASPCFYLQRLKRYETSALMFGWACVGEFWQLLNRSAFTFSQLSTG